MPQIIDPTAKIAETNIQRDVRIAEYCTIHDSSIKIGTVIKERVSLKRSDVGEYVLINAGTYIENVAIGNSVLIGPNCSIVGVTHMYFFPHGTEHQNTFIPIKIGFNVFIGAGTTILPGVTIGDKSVIGAGAIVNINIPDHHLYVGTPQAYKLTKLT